MDAAAVIQSILDHKGTYETNPFPVLNLAPSMPCVTLDTPIPDARRNYMKLSTLVHPDKFSGKPELQKSATEAFQMLVRTFERIANPSFRQQLLKAKASAAATKATRKPSAKKASAPKKPKRKEAQVKGKLGKEGNDDTTSEEESDDESEGDDDTVEIIAAATVASAAVAKRPAKEVLTRNRTFSDACKRTTVKCPKCVTPWMPDDNKQYSLFMGYGLRIHCQLCLLLFGCATAVHACPFCDAPFDYDASEYDDKKCCGKCKKCFGFSYFPVTGDLVNKIREAEEAEEQKRRDAADREARMLARQKSSGEAPTAAHGKTVDEVLELVGQCAVNEECPLCRKRVASKHRSHVESCLLNPVAPKKTPQIRKFLVDDMDEGKKKPAARKPAAKKSTLASKKAPAKKRAREYWSDSD